MLLHLPASCYGTNGYYMMDVTGQPCFLSDSGTCTTCKLQVDDNEAIKCFRCLNNFHGLCKKAPNQICNKSLLVLFLQKSTKKNFVWYCDVCITEIELNGTDSRVSQSSKIKDLEGKIDLLDAKISSISDVLAPSGNLIPGIAPSNGTNSGNNVWQNSSKVTILKSNIVGSPNLDGLEKRIMGEQIEVTNSKRNAQGDVVITCPNSAAADKVKSLANELLPQHTVKDPLIKYSWINVVGFENNHSPDYVFELLVKNNLVFDSIRGKTIEQAKEFLEVKVVKPCRKNPHLYRALLKVSQSVRQVIKLGKDKLRIGLYQCRVYDQAQQVKRCNRCQRYGH